MPEQDPTEFRRIDSELMEDVSLVNGSLGSYVIRLISAIRGEHRAEMKPTDEHDLGSLLIELGERIKERASRRWESPATDKTVD
ncbi:hypothetical protein [Labedaea rhizosphaerae]|uniref:hypothetical protein n=1 Tax=Labedaea rhizosphaerae TaxID=598644 RepID=UPI00105EEC7F|nr:hypothetical protein [Labedaea rhizosphaerae]